MVELHVFANSGDFEMRQNAASDLGLHCLPNNPFRGLPTTIITKTRLFKYIENFTSKNLSFLDKKSLIFFIFVLKT